MVQLGSLSRGVHAVPKLARVCACGREFATYPSVDQRHCSQACSSRFVPRKRRTGETAGCEQCGAAFYRPPTEARKGHARFCSRACHTAAQTKQPVLKTCALDGCEVLMELKPSQAARQYCSKEHEGLGRIKRPLDRRHNGRPARMDNYGYVLLYEPSHPNKSMKGWQYEHRLVVEAVLGRYLASDEQVDHINGVKDDNTPLNLQVLSASDHSVKTVRDLWGGIEALRAEVAEYRRRFGPLERSGD